MMKQQHKLTLVFCAVWALSLLYGELISFWVPFLWTCSWPHHQNNHFPSSSSSSTNSTEHLRTDYFTKQVRRVVVGASSKRNLVLPTSFHAVLPRIAPNRQQILDVLKEHKLTNGRVYPSEYIKVAVLTDPQLMDRTSLHLHPRSLALEIAQFYTDLYMRRAFFTSILSFKPDVILFLGDYFDGGPHLSDDEWQESLHRFKHIFGLNLKGSLAGFQIHFIPGNHDIGYESINSQKLEVVKRYEEEFGIRNYQFTIGMVEFIAVDAQTVDGGLQGHLTSTSWEFIKNVSNDVQLTPRVLLTHIPLYRRDNTSCGPHRGSAVINQRILRTADGQKIVYQNYVTEGSSNQLMDSIKPILILSGHDHDQCTVTHESTFGPVIEHTVGTISWQQGNLYPSFMLLSVSSSGNAKSTPEKAVMTKLCFLPMQTHIYIWYLSLFAVTLVTLFSWPTSGVSFGYCFSDLTACFRTYSSMLIREVKEKTEDENCEYEMMWDAEGSMHLVKKALDARISRQSVRAPAESGRAVMRPTARKNAFQETVSVNVDTGADSEYESIVKVPHKANKSVTKIFIQRLTRTLRMLVVIATVNVPLYMMLLFKDWIDQ